MEANIQAPTWWNRVKRWWNGQCQTCGSSLFTEIVYTWTHFGEPLPMHIKSCPFGCDRSAGVK